MSNFVEQDLICSSSDFNDTTASNETSPNKVYDSAEDSLVTNEIPVVNGVSPDNLDSKAPILWEDPNLPEGWKREIKMRKNGKSVGMFDVYLRSPNGKLLGGKQGVLEWLQKHNLSTDINLFDFCLRGQSNSRSSRQFIPNLTSKSPPKKQKSPSTVKQKVKPVVVKKKKKQHDPQHIAYSRHVFLRMKFKTLHEYRTLKRKTNKASEHVPISSSNSQSMNDFYPISNILSARLAAFKKCMRSGKLKREGLGILPWLKTDPDAKNLLKSFHKNSKTLPTKEERIQSAPNYKTATVIAANYHCISMLSEDEAEEENDDVPLISMSQSSSGLDMNPDWKELYTPLANKSASAPGLSKRGRKSKQKQSTTPTIFNENSFFDQLTSKSLFATPSNHDTSFTSDDSNTPNRDPPLASPNYTCSTSIPFYQLLNTQASL